MRLEITEVGGFWRCIYRGTTELIFDPGNTYLYKGVLSVYVLILVNGVVVANI